MTSHDRYPMWVQLQAQRCAWEAVFKQYDCPIRDDSSALHKAVVSHVFQHLEDVNMRGGGLCAINAWALKALLFPGGTIVGYVREVDAGDDDDTLLCGHIVVHWRSHAYDAAGRMSPEEVSAGKWRDTPYGAVYEPEYREDTRHGRKALCEWFDYMSVYSGWESAFERAGRVVVSAYRGIPDGEPYANQLQDLLGQFSSRVHVELDSIYEKEQKRQAPRSRKCSK